MSELRERAGLTQKELADRTQRDRGYISMLERGQSTPTVRMLSSILTELGVSLVEFFKIVEQRLPK